MHLKHCQLAVTLEKMTTEEMKIFLHLGILSECLRNELVSALVSHIGVAGGLCLGRVISVNLSVEKSTFSSLDWEK